MTDGPARIAVLGLGRSGTAVVRWALSRREAGEDVSVAAFVEHRSDGADEAAESLRALGAGVYTGVTAVPDDGFDLIVASPGIAPHRPLMRSARSLGVPVISELELAFRVSRAPFVAVTGTNGKTTTTALIAHLLTVAGRDARAVGNIGHPAITAAASAGPDTVLVAECSSFQLALTERFRPRVSVLLNITPDHLDWHGSLESYEADKARVFANQGAGDTAVVDADDPGSSAWAARLASGPVSLVRVSCDAESGAEAVLIDGMLTLRTASGDVSLVASDRLQIRGTHNIGNALAASAAALAMGASVESIRDGLVSFAPIEHRLEPVATIRGVSFVNDSKATNPDAVLKALTAFAGTGLIVLLGGRNKGNDFAQLARACASAGARGVAYGEAGDEIDDALAAAGVPHARVGTMDEAIASAFRSAQPGDVVLLSPACASFDQFDDYEHRGRAFREAVHVLARGEAR